MKRVLVIGGASGIGLSLSLYLANQDEVEHVYVLDKKPFDEQYKQDKISAEVFDVTSEDYSLLDNYADLDCKEVWQSVVFVITLFIVYEVYSTNAGELLREYLAQFITIIIIAFLLWRIETLQELESDEKEG